MCYRLNCVPIHYVADATGGGASADRGMGAKGIGLGAGGGVASGVETPDTVGGTMDVVPSLFCGEDMHPRHVLVARMGSFRRWVRSR